MKYQLFTSESRGKANHGWLNSCFSFSFADYYHPERMHFGALRVLNDDIIAGGSGFGKHPHDNMEIISIPLEGALAHKDSLGNESVIYAGDVQVMSAGTGVYHSEFNYFSDKEGKFLQIWIFPDKKNVTPRYGQFTMDQNQMNNQFLQIVSPNKQDNGLWIHQNAWLHLAKPQQNIALEYNLKNRENGVFCFLIAGEASINNQILNKRDALGVWETDNLQIKALQDAFILLIEVPMQNWQ